MSPFHRQTLNLSILIISRFGDLQPASALLSKVKTKSAGRFESNFHSFSHSQLFFPTDFSHHVILPSLPPPYEIEVWLQGTNSHAENSPCLTSSHWHFWYALRGKSGMLTPREQISLRNFFPGEQNRVKQIMQICILMEPRDKKRRPKLGYGW